MWNGLPDIQRTNSRQSKESTRDKKNKQTPPKVSYRGITLKQYFRICDQTQPNQALRQIKEQSCASSASSIAQTPNFNHDDNSRNFRAKIKTEVCQPDYESTFKKTFGKIAELDCRSKGGFPQSLQKNQKGHYIPNKKKEERKKIYSKAFSQSNKEPANIRSTLNSFYQVQENKKRMLKKIQQQKDRANQMRLSEAFFITKYGSRFRIDCKGMKNE